MYYLKKIGLVCLVVILLLVNAGQAFATSGNIVPSEKYSQFLNVDLDGNGTNDFINWAPTNGGATVGDSTVTGYIWAETMGWINLNPTDGGVTNTCSGILGGYAWGQNTGWINFAPTQSTGSNQPKINTTTGQITGMVWSQNYGYIQLSSPDGTYPGLYTTWHGCSSGSGTSSTTTSPGGGGNGNNGGTNTSGSVFGCTNPAATNYNSLATVDDGSCIVPTGTTGSPTTTITVLPPGGGGGTGTGTPPPGGPGGGTIIGTGPGSPGQGPGVGPGNNVNPPNPPTPLPVIAGSQSLNGGLTPGSFIHSLFNGIGLKSTSDVGWVLAALAVIGLLSSVPGLITRFGNLFLTFIIGRKKTRGVVYDSKTKEPLDPAYVTVTDAVTGKEIATAITDMEGRFGFVLKKGNYKIIVNKTHYQFPSVALAGKTGDEVYDNLYFGDVFTVADEEQVITMNVPMDAVGIDWNQQEKRRMNFLKYLMENQKVWGVVFDILFVIGFVASIIITYYYPVWWNILMLALYIVIAALQFSGYGPISVGKITKNGAPLADAIIRVYNVNLNREVAHKVTSDLGGYFILVPKADYYITIEQKNPDGTYTKIFTSSPMRADHGMINKSFSL